MNGMRKAALAAITLLVAAASLTSFAESYRALYDWASHRDPDTEGQELSMRTL